MINLLILAFINALMIVGIYRAYSYTNGMIFGQIRYKLEKLLPEYIQKPLFLCVWCMASIYSFPVYWFYSEATMVNLFQYIIYIPIVSTMAGIINDKLIEA